GLSRDWSSDVCSSDLGRGAHEQVVDRELLLVEVLREPSTFLLVECLRELDEAGEELLNVRAACVVLVDQLLEPLEPVDPGRVQADRKSTRLNSSHVEI